MFSGLAFCFRVWACACRLFYSSGLLAVSWPRQIDKYKDVIAICYKDRLAGTFHLREYKCIHIVIVQTYTYAIHSSQEASMNPNAF